MTRLTERWQDIMAGHARAACRASKDPSTKVGAVIYRDDLSTASTGFNGLPRGIPDTHENLNDRSRKYPRTVHAEANALDYAREQLTGYGMVVTAHPCSVCALRIVNKGIKTVYFLDTGLENTERWGGDMLLAAKIFREAGVALIMIDKNKGLD